MRVLGIEGTAWAASAAVYDTETDDVFVESDTYEPDSGGIHPREAAEHMREAIPSVIETALDHAREHRRGDARADERADASGALDPSGPPIDAVAFSQGPGLGPCLRIVGTAARTLAGTLDVPLVGVNHMVAHLEIGRHAAGFDDPVCLNASGANAHLLAYRDGRYRVLGETMDTGVGNAIDKFTRHVGWSHPGGPKVEVAAADGEYVELPYVVKGMDFSFSGIMSAAKAAVDEGTPVEDVCHGLQETIFAMLTEVSERALSLTGADELVLGGGVAQNARLRSMLETMCTDRDARFHVPEARFLRDNAGMIAVLGAKMYAAGDTIAIEESAVDPNYRPDAVAVSWRDERDRRDDDHNGYEGRVGHEGDVGHDGYEGDEADEADEADESDAPVGAASRTIQGAEAVVSLDPPTVTKRRVEKRYRHSELDARLRRERTAMEARLTSEARRAGVPTPVVRAVDRETATITFEYVGDHELRRALTADRDRSGDRVRTVGEHLATLHGVGVVHGDPTTRNVRIDDDRTYLIDFGLGYYSDHVEDYAMDLHIFEQSLTGTATDSAALCETLRDGYRSIGDEAVLRRLDAIEARGRYQSAVGE